MPTKNKFVDEKLLIAS